MANAILPAGSPGSSLMRCLALPQGSRWVGVVHWRGNEYRTSKLFSTSTEAHEDAARMAALLARGVRHG